ncbi:hypothetical protein SPRG_01107 [Saprolegnia parasitica CBS 223.65]|uniref:Uncharacterized protein n=1 Tax=Saprolegnia parasitica (strain CBS 223.65) TaxID=695850 RepID=A0A067CX02_SAPPC|nr:hypothetical protein SPRG_01107 [Saprolegnia parasitica CBS 223.65]KDO35043.1 hypothetical protein SPRG_01107 [Saprolegnia parasitica CBS 223.65]|eukprot:XP_012194696.1 hypothetical protein SPRG_01107 [Saprolegnia parasitica CBS 223.65]
MRYPVDAPATCVDICVGASPYPTCFTNTTDCIHKRQQPGDYDTLLLDQLFLPQFCRDLLTGTDPTLTHRPVAAYPLGIHCKMASVPSRLLIHGLWPNYDGGYPACCNTSATTLNRPFNPYTWTTRFPSLLADMIDAWTDATQLVPIDMTCELWNHEFQKHGLCYTDASSGYEDAAARYFADTLAVAQRLSAATTAINAVAGSDTPVMTTETIQSLYTHTVEVHCVQRDESLFLSAVRSCWSKPHGAIATAEQVDCTSASAPDACPPKTSLSLAPYKAPRDGARMDAP